VYSECSPAFSSKLLAVAANHLHCLRNLSMSDEFSWRPPHPLDRNILLGLAASPAGQQLETMRADIVLPDMECVIKLLAMPKLKLLEGDTSFPKEHEDVQAHLLASWPDSKPPMELRIWRASLCQLAALPLHHFSSISLEVLGLPEGEQDPAQVMQTVAAAARAGLKLSIGGVESSDWSVGQLPPLGPDCPIRLTTSCLKCKEVEVDQQVLQDMAAAWGSQITAFEFINCELSHTAISAAALTASLGLQHIEIFGSRATWYLPDIALLVGCRSA
jgi:hypothetical protein